MLSFKDDCFERVPPPNIALVAVLNGLVCYSTYNQETRQFIDVHEETYEESLKIYKAGLEPY
jgi:hypothetical protein